jgi:acyl-CoA thioester hydrolase
MSDIFDGPSLGVLRNGTHRLPLRIYYEDTDFSGVVYHANYLRFLERGRTEFIRALGVDQRALHGEQGVAFAVRAMRIEFLRPALMDDLVEVETQVEATDAPRRGPLLTLSQRLRRGAELLTTATVEVVCLKAGRPQRLPAVLREALARHAAHRPDTENFGSVTAR